MAKKVKKARRSSPINDLRQLTRRQAMSEDQIASELKRLHAEIDDMSEQIERLVVRDTEGLWLVTEAACPNKFCHGSGVCDWCKRAGDWIAGANT